MILTQKRSTRTYIKHWQYFLNLLDILLLLTRKFKTFKNRKRKTFKSYLMRNSWKSSSSLSDRLILSSATNYSRMAQVKFVEDSLKKIWRGMEDLQKIIPNYHNNHRKAHNSNLKYVTSKFPIPLQILQALRKPITLLNANSTKWSNLLKQFVGCCWRIVWVCLTIWWSSHSKS